MYSNLLSFSFLISHFSFSFHQERRRRKNRKEERKEKKKEEKQENKKKLEKLGWTEKTEMTNQKTEI